MLMTVKPQEMIINFLFTITKVHNHAKNANMDVKCAQIQLFAKFVYHKPKWFLENVFVTLHIIYQIFTIFFIICALMHLIFIKLSDLIT